MVALNTTININPETYLKDPKSTELGKKILENSILLIDKLGLENFNFKKLKNGRDVTSTSERSRMTPNFQARAKTGSRSARVAFLHPQFWTFKSCVN